VFSVFYKIDLRLEQTKLRDTFRSFTGGAGDREGGACRGEILPRTQINAPSDIKTHLGGIDDRESHFYSLILMNEVKKVSPAERALFSFRAKGLVLEHHEGSICVRACCQILIN